MDKYEIGDEVYFRHNGKFTLGVIMSKKTERTTESHLNGKVKRSKDVEIYLIRRKHCHDCYQVDGDSIMVLRSRPNAN